MIDREAFLQRLQHVKGNGSQYRAKCPVREHSNGDTLSILFNQDGRILLHCHGSCEANEILEAIGLSLTDLYPDGAIRDFMASATVKPKQNKYDAWIEVMDRQRGKFEKGERFTDDTLKLAREMYKRSKA